jgi:hypothetical protein
MSDEAMGDLLGASVFSYRRWIRGEVQWLHERTGSAVMALLDSKSPKRPQGPRGGTKAPKPTVDTSETEIAVMRAENALLREFLEIFVGGARR